MPSGDEIVQVARAAFEDAHAHLDADLAGAKTAADARVIQDNHDRSLSSYLEALRTAFEQNGAIWKQALADAQKAKQAVDAARAAAVQLTQRIAQMTELTTAVSNLIATAK